MGSDFLFAQPSFWSGVARLLDLGATFDSYNHSRTTVEADHRAISADWQVVGRDLDTAITRYGTEQQESEQEQQLALNLG